MITYFSEARLPTLWCCPLCITPRTTGNADAIVRIAETKSSTFIIRTSFSVCCNTEKKCRYRFRATVFFSMPTVLSQLRNPLLSHHIRTSFQNSEYPGWKAPRTGRQRRSHCIALIDLMPKQEQKWKKRNTTVQSFTTTRLYQSWRLVEAGCDAPEACIHDTAVLVATILLHTASEVSRARRVVLEGAVHARCAGYGLQTLTPTLARKARPGLLGWLLNIPGVVQLSLDYLVVIISSCVGQLNFFVPSKPARKVGLSCLRITKTPNNSRDMNSRQRASRSRQQQIARWPFGVRHGIFWSSHLQQPTAVCTIAVDSFVSVRTARAVKGSNIS